MPSKKPPPDHTTEATVRAKIREEVVEEVVQEAKEDLSIDSDFDFYGRVERVRQSYFLALHAEQENPLRYEQRILFEDVRAKAKELQECISRLGYLEQARLGDWPDLDRLKSELVSLEINTEKALGGLPDGEDKRDKPFQSFIFEMHAIYREATGDDDKYTHDHGAGETTGPFFELLETLLPIIGVQKTASALSDDIDRASLPKKQPAIDKVEKKGASLDYYISKLPSPKNIS